MPFSPVTEFVIEFTLPSLCWYCLLLWQQPRGGPSIKGTILALGVLCWTAFTWAVVRYDIDGPILGEFPARTLVYFVFRVVLSLIFRGWLTRERLSQRLLVSLQLFRVIGLVFIFEQWRGTLPAIFAEPAGWGDFITSVIAAWILCKYGDRMIPRGPLVLLSAVGLTDFASAFFCGFASALTPLQIFSFDMPNRVDEFPTGLIPVALVPFAVVAQILSLSQRPAKQTVNGCQAAKP